MSAIGDEEEEEDIGILYQGALTCYNDAKASVLYVVLFAQCLVFYKDMKSFAKGSSPKNQISLYDVTSLRVTASRVVLEWFGGFMCLGSEDVNENLGAWAEAIKVALEEVRKEDGSAAKPPVPLGKDPLQSEGDESLRVNETAVESKVLTAQEAIEDPEVKQDALVRFVSLRTEGLSLLPFPTMSLDAQPLQGDPALDSGTPPQSPSSIDDFEAAVVGGGFQSDGATNIEGSLCLEVDRAVIADEKVTSPSSVDSRTESAATIYRSRFSPNSRTGSRSRVRGVPMADGRGNPRIEAEGFATKSASSTSRRDAKVVGARHEPVVVSGLSAARGPGMKSKARSPAKVAANVATRTTVQKVPKEKAPVALKVSDRSLSPHPKVPRLPLENLQALVVEQEAAREPACTSSAVAPITAALLSADAGGQDVETQAAIAVQEGCLKSTQCVGSQRFPSGAFSSCEDSYMESSLGVESRFTSTELLMRDEEWVGRQRHILFGAKELRAKLRQLKVPAAAAVEEPSSPPQISFNNTAAEERWKSQMKNEKIILTTLQTRREEVEKVACRVTECRLRIQKAPLWKALHVLERRLDLRATRPATEHVADQFQLALEREGFILEKTRRKLDSLMKGGNEILAALQSTKADCKRCQWTLHIDRSQRPQEFLDKVLGVVAAAITFCDSCEVALNLSEAEVKKAVDQSTTSCIQSVGEHHAVKGLIEAELKATRAAIAKCEKRVVLLERQLVAGPGCGSGGPAELKSDRSMGSLPIAASDLVYGADKVAPTTFNVLRTKIKAAAYGVGHFTKKELNVVVKRFDKTGSGKVDYQELRTIMRKEVRITAAVATDAELLTLCVMLDPKQTGFVSVKDINEFLSQDEKLVEARWRMARTSADELKDLEAQLLVELRNKTIALRLDDVCRSVAARPFASHNKANRLAAYECDNNKRRKPCGSPSGTRAPTGRGSKKFLLDQGSFASLSTNVSSPASGVGASLSTSASSPASGAGEEVAGSGSIAVPKVYLGHDDWNARNQELLSRAERAREQVEWLERIVSSDADVVGCLAKSGADIAVSNERIQKEKRQSSIAASTRTFTHDVEAELQRLGEAAQRLRQSVLWEYSTVAKKRLKLRSTRPSTELVYDGFQAALEKEWQELQSACGELSQLVEESQELQARLQEARDELRTRKLKLPQDKTRFAGQFFHDLREKLEKSTLFCAKVETILSAKEVFVKRSRAATDAALKKQIERQIKLKRQLDVETEVTKKAIQSTTKDVDKLRNVLLHFADSGVAGGESRQGVQEALKQLQSFSALPHIRAALRAVAIHHGFEEVIRRLDTSGTGQLREEGLRAAFRRVLKIPASLVPDVEILKICRVLEDPVVGCIPLDSLTYFLVHLDSERLDTQLKNMQEHLASLKALHEEMVVALRYKSMALKIDSRCINVTTIDIDYSGLGSQASTRLTPTASTMEPDHFELASPPPSGALGGSVESTSEGSYIPDTPQSSRHPSPRQQNTTSELSVPAPAVAVAPSSYTSKNFGRRAAQPGAQPTPLQYSAPKRLARSPSKTTL